MISKSDILKFVRHVHRRGQGIPDRHAMHPRREWLIGLLVFLFVTGVGAVVSMITFENYKNIDKRTYVTDVAVPVYNEARVKTVLSDFFERKRIHTNLVDGIIIPGQVLEAPVASATEGTTTVVTTASTTEVIAE